MADRYICLPRCTSKSLLKMAADAIRESMMKSGDAPAVELLKTCRVVIGERAHDLYLDSRFDNRWTKQCEHFHKTLTDLYGNDQDVARADRINGNGLPIEEAACVLLRQCRGAQFSDTQRFLLAGAGLTTERVQFLLNTLQATATQAAVALVKGHRRDVSDTSYAVFDVYADQTRYAAVSALIVSNEFADCTKLEQFGGQQNGVYLTLPPLEDSSSQRTAGGLDADSLDNFVYLMRQSPQSFGFLPNEGERRLAMMPTPGAGFQILPLSGQAFQHFFRAIPHSEAVAELVELTADTAAMQRLEQSLAAGSIPVGYRLTLQPNRRRILKDEQHINKIRAQIEKLTQDLAYHWNMGLVRPKLWRFAQWQLPALVDALCSFPMQDLKSGRILYGYASTRRHASGQDRRDYATTSDSAEGAHYLYISQDAFMAQGNPLPYWEGILGRLSPTIRYWLDPFWARFYHPANEALVFVPEGTVLNPPIHRAEVEEMDQYLRKALPRWFRGAFPGDAVTAARPIYLFDGYTSGHNPIRYETDSDVTEMHSYTPDAGPILVTVLDLAKFRPVAAEMSWLSDNLLLMETLGVRPLMEQMADDAGRARLAQTVQEGRNQAVKALNQSASQLAGELTTKTAELTRVMTEELQASLQATESAVTDIQTLDRNLDKYRALHAQMKGLHEQSEALLKGLLQAEAELDQRIRNLEGSVRQSTGAAEQARKRLEAEVETQVGKIESTYRRLTERIERLG